MSDNILVGVRVRPLIAREEVDSPALHWQTRDGNTITQVDPFTNKVIATPYVFDRVFSSEYGSDNVYAEVARPIVESALTGFNGTVFAYGQTSSGKTYTMMGDRKNPGILPLAIQNIFSAIENTPDREYLIRVSYMEIYNENITDLLVGREKRGKSLNIREDSSGSVYVADLKEECVNCQENLLALMKRGEKNRHVGVTNMNERSSRSHTIFRMIIESRERSEEDGGEDAVTVSHLNLVDLAGSENASQSGATGDRLKEGGFINKSLFMLGRVISQLSEGERHVNYRDSKLTRILQLSLGGNAKTAIICTITPAAVEQTISTLRFASRAKSIKNKPIVNEVLSEAALLKRYAKEIKNLKHNLEQERKTDKAQEVEQVREMLDEQARRNQELEAKINELKAKLIVSSVPRGKTDLVQKNKNKARRETWAAPAAMRISMGPVPLGSMKMDHCFRRPELPPWAECSKASPVNSVASDSSDTLNDCSVSSEDFGMQDVSFMLNVAEQSKMGCLETVLESPEPSHINTKRRKRVKFDITPSPPAHTKEAGCQTDDSSLPNTVCSFTPTWPTTPKREEKFSQAASQGTPGTPAHIIRSRNKELLEKLSHQDKWLDSWQEEMRGLQEFHKIELKLLEESFENRIGSESEHGCKMNPDAEENQSLRRSLHDSQMLLMDANQALAERCQNVESLTCELERVKEENERRATFEQELISIRHQHDKLKKDYEDRESKVRQLENERHDFDIRMELALAKQKRKEEDIRRSLDDAWEEIAAYERSDMDEVRRRSHRSVELQKQLSDLTADAKRTQEIISSLELQLKEAQIKWETSEQESQQLRTHLQEMKNELANKNDKCEDSASTETLERELTEAQETIQDLEEKVIQHVQAIDSLQAQLVKKEEEDSIGSIKSVIESQNLQRLEKSGREEVLPHQQSFHSSESGSPWDISCKISESLQVLEESVMVPSTPGRDSASSFLDEPLIQTNDLVVIKQQLMKLQEALIAQDQQQQRRLHHHATEMEWRLEYHNQVIEENERDATAWKLQEAFFGEYTMYSWPLHGTSSNHPGHSFPRQSDAFLNIEQDLRRATEEIRMKIKSEYEEKFQQEREALEARLQQDTFVEGDTLYAPCRRSGGPQSLADELRQVGMNITTLSDTLETSVLDLDSVSQTVEMQQLKLQVELLTKENNAMCSTIEELQKKSDMLDEVKTMKEEVHQNEGCSDKQNISTSKQNNGTLTQIEPLSLADDLSECSMIITPCHGAFEFTDGNATLVNDTDEIHSLKQKLQAVSEENDIPKDNLQVSLAEAIEDSNASQRKVKEREPAEDGGTESVVKPLHIDLELVRNERDAIDTYAKKLEEELSCKNICEEELHYLRWNINTLKEEKSDLEKELKLIQEENDSLVLQKSTTQTDTRTDSTKTEVDKEDGVVEVTQVAENDTEEILQETVEELKTHLQSKTEELEDTRKSLDSLMEKYSLIVEQINHARDNLSTLREGFGTETSKVDHDKDVDKESHDLKNLVMILKAFDEELQKRNEDLNTMKEQLDEKTVNLNAVKEQLNEKTADLNKVKEQLDSLRSAEEGNDFTEEQKQSQTHLDHALERIELLVKEREEQHLVFENRLANVVGEKDSELEEFITNFTEKEEALEEKVKELQENVKESETLRVSIEEKDKQLQSHLGDILSLQTKVQDLELVLSAKCEDYSALKDSHSELQINFSQFQLQHDNDKQNSERTVELYKEKLDIKTQEFTNLLDSYEEHKKLLHAAESELEALKAKHSEEIEALNNCSKITETHQDSSVLEQSIVDQKLDELERVRNEHARQVDECSQLRDTIDNLKIMLSKREEELKQALTEHKKETDYQIEELCKKEEDIVHMQMNIATKNEEVARLKSCVEAKDHKLERLEREMKKEEEKLKASNDEKEAFKNKLDMERDSKVQDLQANLEHLNKAYEEVCSDRKHMVTAIKEEKEAKEILEDECKTLKVKLENLEEDYLYVSDALRAMETEITSKNESLLSLEAELKKQQEEVAVLSNKKLELIDEQIADHKKMERLIGEIEKYETEMSEKDEHLLKVKTDLSETRTKHNEVEELVISLQATNTEMASKLKAKEEEALTYKKDEEKVESLSEKLMAAEESLFTMQNEHKEKIVDLERCLSDSYLQKEDLCLKLAGIEEQYKILSEELEVKKGEIQEKNLLQLQLSNDNENLKIELQAIQQELSQADELIKTAEAEWSQRLSCTEAEKINLEEELSLSKISENNMKEQLEANSCEIDKLVTMVEKYETEMSEKDEQMLSQTEKYEMEIASKEKQILELNEEIERKNAVFSKAKQEFDVEKRNLQERTELQRNNIEELKKKCSDFEKNITLQIQTDSTSAKSLMEKLVDAENKYAILQADFNVKMKNHTEEINSHLLEKQQLLSVLKQKEEVLHSVYEKNTKLKQDLNDKEEKCCQLDAEMDDMVKYYEKEKTKDEERKHLASKLALVEKELLVTKSKLMETQSGTSASPHKLKASGETDDQNRLREIIAQLREELHVKQEDLIKKEEECKALDAEMEDMMKHYKQQHRIACEQYDLITQQLNTTQVELSETKTKLSEVSQLGKTHVSGSGFMNSTDKRIFDSQETHKDGFSKEEELENEKERVQSRCVALEAAAVRYKEKINELQKQVNPLEEKLKVSMKRYDCLAEEHNKWKLEYARLSKECEQYKSLLAKSKLMKDDLERENKDLVTRVNILTNSSVASETCDKDYHVSTRQKRISSFEKERDSMKLEYAKLMEKLKDTEAALDSLRRNQGVVSDETFQQEIACMKEKMAEVEGERTILSTNYASLEQDYKILQKEVEDLRRQVIVARSTPLTPTLQQPIPLSQPEISMNSSTRTKTAQEEMTDLEQNHSSLQNSIKDDEDVGSLREHLIRVEREKNELKFRLRALNAPAEKRLRVMEEEMKVANSKVASLRQELRRVQASKCMDSTVCEMNTKAPCTSDPPKIEYDYSSGAGVVLELQVLDLKNKVYNIEKKNKELENKTQILELDTDHYKKKAEEWKYNCLKERKALQNIKKEMEMQETEVKKYQTLLEDKSNLLERRQFEIGHQREKIEKLEREKMEKAETTERERPPILAFAAQPGTGLPSSLKKDTDLTDAGCQEMSSSGRGDGHQLGIYNARTRIERLPEAKQTQDSEELPMWQTMDKENKDHSKYYLPTRYKKMSDENCKNQ